MTTKKVNYQDLLNINNVKTITEVENLISRACLKFDGQITDLYMAVGALVVGRLFGYRIVRLTVDSKAYAKYQKVLDLGLDPGSPPFKFHDWMRDTEVLAYKSVGLALVQTMSEYWAAAKGSIAELPMIKRREISS